MPQLFKTRLCIPEAAVPRITLRFQIIRIGNLQEWIHVVCRKTVRTLLCSDPAVHDQGTIQSNIEILCKYIGVQCFPYCCKMRQIPARCPYNADAIPLCAQKHSFAWLTHLRSHRYHLILTGHGLSAIRCGSR